MTIELLEKYRGICSAMVAIKTEIDSGYVPIASPTGKESGGGFSSVPGNPTERAAFRVIQLKERLEEYIQQQRELGIQVEEWLLTLNDPEIESIVRWHYIIGLTWRETNTKVYGYPDKYRTRKKIYRYFGKEK